LCNQESYPKQESIFETQDRSRSEKIRHRTLLLESRDRQNPESEWSRSVAFIVGFGVELECVFCLIVGVEWSGITIGFPNFENFKVGVESEYDIRKIFGGALE